MAPPLVPLKELGRITAGINPKRYEAMQGIDYPLVSVKDLENLLVGSTQTTVQLLLPDPQKYQLKRDDVVIAIRGSLLRSSVIAESLQGSVSNQNTAFFRPEDKLINSVYLAALLRSGYVEQLPSFRKMGSATTLPALRVSDLRDLEIPLPTLSIQRQISQLFISLDKFKQSAISEIQVRESLSQTALFKALED